MAWRPLDGRDGRRSTLLLAAEGEHRRDEGEQRAAEHLAVFDGERRARDKPRPPLAPPWRPEPPWAPASRPRELAERGGRRRGLVGRRRRRLEIRERPRERPASSGVSVAPARPAAAAAMASRALVTWTISLAVREVAVSPLFSFVFRRRQEGTASTTTPYGR